MLAKAQDHLRIFELAWQTAGSEGQANRAALCNTLQASDWGPNQPLAWHWPKLYDQAFEMVANTRAAAPEVPAQAATQAAPPAPAPQSQDHKLHQDSLDDVDYAAAQAALQDLASKPGLRLWLRWQYPEN